MSKLRDGIRETWRRRPGGLGFLPSNDQAAAGRLLAPALSRALEVLAAVPPDLRLQQRHDKFRRLGLVGIDGA